MAGFVSNRGKKLKQQWIFNGVALPTNYYAALLTNDTVPDEDVNLMSDVTEMAAGNGYTSGGISLTPNTTDFPSVTEDDANDNSTISIKTLTWTAAGGDIPSSGNGARWLALTTDEGTIANRQIVICFDLVSERTATSGNTIDVTNLVIRYIDGV